jgi:hypothetical protein
MKYDSVYFLTISPWNLGTSLLFTGEPLFDPGSRVTSCEILDERSDTGEGFAPNFLGFTLLIIIQPLFHIHLSPPPEMYDRPEQAAHYHTFSIFISDPVVV